MADPTYEERLRIEREKVRRGARIGGIIGLSMAAAGYLMVLWRWMHG